MWSSWEVRACLDTAAGNLPLEIASSSPRRAVMCSGVESCTDFLCTARGRGIKLESFTYIWALELESSIDVNRRMAEASFDMFVGVEVSSSPYDAYDGGSKFGGVFGRYIVLCGLLRRRRCEVPRQRNVVFMKPTCVQRKQCE
jgi:hypothetical protein